MSDHKLSTRFTDRPERLIELAEHIRHAPWAPETDDYPGDAEHALPDGASTGPFKKGVMFNMANYFRRTESCGTVCCIAGAAVLAYWSDDMTRDEMENLAPTYGGEGFDYFNKARQYLGLKDGWHAAELFMSHGISFQWANGEFVTADEVKPEIAARVMVEVARGTEPRIAWQEEFRYTYRPEPDTQEEG